MSVTDYVALSFIETPDGPAPGHPQECPSETIAISTARGLARQTSHIGRLLPLRLIIAAVARLLIACF